MKTQELSIGNIVKIDDEYLGPIEGKVTSLKESGEVELLLSVSKGNGRHFVCGSDDIFPIPITEELLTKRKGDEDNYFMFCDNSILTFTKLGDAIWDVRIQVSFPNYRENIQKIQSIRFVHELQNAYCLVTGKELEIKL